MPHVPRQCGQLKSVWCAARAQIGMVLLLIGREGASTGTMLDAGGGARMLPGAEDALAACYDLALPDAKIRSGSSPLSTLSLLLGMI